MRPQPDRMLRELLALQALLQKLLPLLLGPRGRPQRSGPIDPGQRARVIWDRWRCRTAKTLSRR
eukprot:14266700-Alexandrium_andersonii.AAC.1